MGQQLNIRLPADSVCEQNVNKVLDHKQRHLRICSHASQSSTRYLLSPVIQDSKSTNSEQPEHLILSTIDDDRHF